MSQTKKWAETLGGISSRFWSKVEPTGFCWNWTGSVTPKGYGHFHSHLPPSAHRVAYVLLVGPMPPGLELDHLCRNRRCVNPDHLEPVTHAENLRRSRHVMKASSNQRAKARCPAGHEYTSDNTRTYRGARHCRTCSRDRQASFRANAREEGLTVRAWHAKHKK